MTEFTKGKWEARNCDVYHNSWGVTVDDSYYVADCFNTKNSEANARLIAAAPEMYELLKEELIPTSDYGGILSFSRETKVKELLARINGEAEQS